MKIIDRPSDQQKHRVDLVTDYSNHPDLAYALVNALQQLRAAQERPLDSTTSVRSTGRSKQPRPVADRLGDANVRAIVEAADAGTPKWQLAERYGISLSSVQRLVRRYHKQQAAELGAGD
jgi:hypothetical protein